MAKIKKDRYGGFSVGMAVEKPKSKDEYRFNNAIAQVYKRSISESIARAVYENFDFEESNIEGKQCVQIRLSVLPYDEYERLKRRAARGNVKKKGSE